MSDGFTGWFRPTGGSWRAACQAPSQADCWDKLLRLSLPSGELEVRPTPPSGDQQALVLALAERVAAQSEILSRRAERPRGGPDGSGGGADGRRGLAPPWQRGKP
jgi:hypothetical protein